MESKNLFPGNGDTQPTRFGNHHLKQHFPRYRFEKFPSETTVRGASLAQSVEHQTPDFGLGHDLMVRGFKPRIRLCADSSEPRACFRFYISLSLCPSPAHALSLKSKQTFKKRRDGKYCELYIKFENLGEIDKFTEKYNCISVWK